VVSGQVFSKHSDLALGQLPLFLLSRSSTGIEMKLASIIKRNCANNYNVRCSQRTEYNVVRSLKEFVSRTPMNRTRAASENEGKEDTMAWSGPLIHSLSSRLP